MTAGDGAQGVLCIYRVKPGQDQAFLRLLAVHWPTLRRAGLVTAFLAVEPVELSQEA